MKAKFITVKGSERLGTEPFYMGVLQHERTMSRREAYEYIAGRTGYTPTAVRAVFMAVAEYIRENQARGNITYIDGVASIRNYVRGAFEGLFGPWVRGCNVLMVNAVEMEPFRFCGDCPLAMISGCFMEKVSIRLIASHKNRLISHLRLWYN